jgi:hypothetical protein
MLRDLETAGYVYRWKERDAAGQYIHRTEVFESVDHLQQWLENQGLDPQPPPTAGSSRTGKSSAGKSSAGKARPLVITDQAITDLAITEINSLSLKEDDNPQQRVREGKDLKIPIPESLPPQEPSPVNSAFASSTATEIPSPLTKSTPPPAPAPAAAARQQAAARLEEAQWGTPDLPAWRTGRGRNEWNEPIVEGIRLWLESLAKGGKRTRADAIAYIAKRESPISAEHDSLLARVDEIKSQLNAKGAGRSVRSSADGMTNEERQAFMEAEFKRQSANRQISA